ncbi:ArsR family transcriptional regulator [Candidatus Campbellbacteria bacterium]|nr:ArsR family transcriptional regulator [Candidatus Campbellbacteria bacterium]
MDISVLSNEKRLRLLLCLEKPHSVSQLLEKCNLSQSALSQHLTKLKRAGFVNCSRHGNRQIYTTKNKKIIKVAKSIIELI